jgi:hypothetical protein
MLGYIAEKHFPWSFETGRANNLNSGENKDTKRMNH